jgi:hypothetical protein
MMMDVPFARLLNKSSAILRPSSVPLFQKTHLDAGRVQHNTDAAGGGGRRQVAPELGADNSIRPVCPQNLTPDAAKLCRVGSVGVFRLVDKGNAFSQVELCGRLVLDALHLDQGGVLVLVAQAALVPHDNSADVETVEREKGMVWLVVGEGKGTRGMYVSEIVVE